MHRHQVLPCSLTSSRRSLSNAAIAASSSSRPHGVLALAMSPPKRPSSDGADGRPRDGESSRLFPPSRCPEGPAAHAAAVMRSSMSGAVVMFVAAASIMIVHTRRLSTGLFPSLTKFVTKVCRLWPSLVKNLERWLQIGWAHPAPPRLIEPLLENRTPSARHEDSREHEPSALA